MGVRPGIPDCPAVWLVAKHCGLHVVKAAFEAACAVFGVQKNGYKLMHFEAQQKIGLLAFGDQTRLSSIFHRRG